MLKTALLLSGQYRTLDYTIANWRQFVMEPFDCLSDFYLSIYETNGKRLDQADISSRGALCNAKFDSTILDEEYLKTLHHCKKLIMENYQDIALKQNFKSKSFLVKSTITKTFNQDRRFEWFFSQYYKRYTGIQYLLKQDYDLVICSRPDFKPTHTPDITDLNPNNIYISMSNPLDGYHDFYIISSPQNLLKIFNIYKEVNTKVVPHFLKTDPNRLTCGHSLLTYYIDNVLNLPVTTIKLFGDLQR
jgi:hypothetical protein